MREPPFETALKPYGRALLELAGRRDDIVCFSGDLTRQCEVDLFQERFPDRFIHAGMAEANMIGMAGAMARRGFVPFVHTFGVFATRRPLDQIVNAVAYPRLPVRIVGFMPGISSPGGPSHQAIEDVALMRALPNMTVVDLADATEIEKALPVIADVDGPVYLRLKRGEIPVVFDDDHQFSLDRAQVLRRGTDVAIFASGMMVPTAIAAVSTLVEAGVDAALVDVPVIKPLDAEAIVEVASSAQAVITAENHSIIGGLGSAVAEAMAEAGIGRELRRIGLKDTFAEGAKTADSLFRKYSLTTSDIVSTAWSLSNRAGPAPQTPALDTASGEYSPV